MTVVPRRPDRAARYHPGSLRPRRRTATLPACSAHSSSSSPSPPLLASAGTALGHAVLASSSPAADTRLAAAPEQVTLTFSEPVEIVQSEDIDVVDAEGNDVTGGPATNDAQARVVEIPLRPGLADGTYTVRYKVVSSDSHVIGGVLVFGVGPGELGQPFLGGTNDGPSETGPWGVSSRFLEMVGLGGLVGLLAFRWLVWGPAVRGRRARDGTARRC